MDLLTLVVLFVAAMLAGGVNAVAGGGTVISFPALVWAGLPLISANATNAFALVPGSVGSAYAYRADLAQQRRRLIILLIPTLIGSLLGAWIVSSTSEQIFRRVVPFLILFATLLFAFSRQINGAIRKRTNAIAAAHHSHEHITPAGFAFGIAFQFLISTYGGYFGAGIGILMLSSLSLIGMTDIHRMNALKTALAVAINGTAVVFFLLNGRVNLPVGIWMAIGALLGGYLMARYAKRISQRYLRAFVVVMGLVAAVYMFARSL